jgi:hypothetical protein
MDLHHLLLAGLPAHSGLPPVNGHSQDGRACLKGRDCDPATGTMPLPKHPVAGKVGMAEYRAYAVGIDGHIVGFEALVCADDVEAINGAKRLANGHDIELWTGVRLVTRLNRKTD